MKYNEKKIASFQQDENKLQLLKLTYTPEGYTPGICSLIKYQVRLNRKVIETSISEYQCRKIFATYAQNIVLQLKIY